MHGDIAVTRSGGLVYADWDDRSINLVRCTQIQTLLSLRGWNLSVCVLRHLGTSWLSCYAFIDITVKQELYATPDPRRNNGFSGMISVTPHIQFTLIKLRNNKLFFLHPLSRLHNNNSSYLVFFSLIFHASVK